jgi:hypothetical protein
MKMNDGTDNRKGKAMSSWSFRHWAKYLAGVIWEIRGFTE